MQKVPPEVLRAHLAPFLEHKMIAGSLSQVARGPTESFKKGLSRERSARCKQETKEYTPARCLESLTCFPMCLLHNCAALLQTLKILSIPDFLTVVPTNPRITPLLAKNEHTAFLKLHGVPTRLVPPFTPFLKSVAEKRKATMGSWTLTYGFNSGNIAIVPLVGGYNAYIPGKTDLQSFCELLQTLHKYGVAISGQITVELLIPKEARKLWENSVKRASLEVDADGKRWQIHGFRLEYWSTPNDSPDSIFALRKDFEIPVED
jgi:hypothetical protein